MSHRFTRPAMARLWSVGLALTAQTLGLSGAAAADALDRWHWRNPSPPLNEIASVVWAEGRFIVVGGWLGMILSSSDGTNWVRESNASEEILYGVCHGSNQWVAVGDAGSIVTSPDGSCWTSRASGTSEKLNSVVYGNGKFIAVGHGGTVLSSSDGAQWTRQNSGTNVELRGVSYGNGAWVAVGSDYGAFGPINEILLTSADAVTWTDRTATVREIDQYLHAVAYGNNTFVAVGWSSITYQGGAIYTSCDGVNWARQTYDPAFAADNIMDLISVGFGNGIFVAAGSDGILTSRDGTNWTQPNFEPYYNLYSGSAVAYGAGICVLADNPENLGYGSEIKTSLDLIHWTSQRSGPTKRLFHICSSGGLSVAVGEGAILSSSNGVAWSAQDPGTTQPIYAITHPSNLWVAAGERGIVITSTNAISWAPQNSGTTNALYDLAYGDGRFLAVGGADTIVSSTNSVDWISYGSGTTSNWLRTIDYANGSWVAANDHAIIQSTDGVHWVERFSNGGDFALFALKFVHDRWLGGGHDTTSFVVSSQDGTNWTKQTLPTWTVWTDVTYGGGYYVMAGLDQPGFLLGRIATSPDSTNWTFRFPDSYSIFGGVTYVQGTFIVVGGGGTILQSDPLLAPAPLQLQNPRLTGGGFQLTLRGGTGEVYRVDSSADLFNWLPAGTVTNASGCVIFRDANSARKQRQVYRAVNPSR